MTNLRREDQTMNNQDLTTHIDAFLEALRKHPFIRGAMSGQLTRDQSVRWVMCAGRESRSFPTILTKLLQWTADPRIREILQENLDDELGNGNHDDAHFVHYLSLLDSLGIDRGRFDDYAESAGIQFALSLAFNLADSQRAAWAIGYMLLNEAMTPVTYDGPHATHSQNTSQAYKRTSLTCTSALMPSMSKPSTRPCGFFPTTLQRICSLDSRLAKRGMEVLLDEAYGVLDFHPGHIDITSKEYDPAKYHVIAGEKRS